MFARIRNRRRFAKYLRMVAMTERMIHGGICLVDGGETSEGCQGPSQCLGCQVRAGLKEGPAAVAEATAGGVVWTGRAFIPR